MWSRKRRTPSAARPRQGWASSSTVSYTHLDVYKRQIFAFTGVLILWMVVNTLLAAKAFDPFPFILLNLVLSCVAAIQAPLDVYKRQ